MPVDIQQRTSICVNAEAKMEFLFSIIHSHISSSIHYGKSDVFNLGNGSGFSVREVIEAA
jgi:hypothetical protein